VPPPGFFSPLIGPFSVDLLRRSLLLTSPFPAPFASTLVASGNGDSFSRHSFPPLRNFAAFDMIFGFCENPSVHLERSIPAGISSLRLYDLHQSERVRRDSIPLLPSYWSSSEKVSEAPESKESFLCISFVNIFLCLCSPQIQDPPSPFSEKKFCRVIGEFPAKISAMRPVPSLVVSDVACQILFADFFLFDRFPSPWTRTFF